MVDMQMGMPAKREPCMRQLRHLLRLHHGRVSARDAELFVVIDGLKIRTVEDPVLTNNISARVPVDLRAI
jgi:hypothetical protein